ncbi:MAG TPA: MerR family transcriptional regulator [Rhizomicrobium sp.]|nr:MerR family transcriptional regulator [Rhizomicrobium sp.]
MSSAAFAYSHKSAEAFRTISEVAIELDVPQHVLRFWESRFVQIKPVKRAGGRRYYRPEDVDLLKGIRALLYSDGFTIKGVQKVLKERGLRHVAEVGRGGMPAKPEPVVIEKLVEKIVYIEKPVAAAPAPAPAKKPRAHLRAVPDTMSLPFFDEPAPVAKPPRPARDFPVLDAAPEPVVEKVVEPVAESPVEAMIETIREEFLAGEERERLEELLDELTGLKDRLQAARERFN